MKQILWLLLLSLALTAFGSAHADIPPPPPEIRVEAVLDAPVKSRVGADGTAAWYSGIYQYDGAGNIKAIGNETFVYDPVSRLRSGQVHTGTTVATQAYTYDSFGNMRSIVTSPSLPTDVAAIAVNPATNRLTDASYDAAGNMTFRAGYQYNWDELGELTSRVDPIDVRTERYAYNAAGERIAIFSLHSNSSMRTLRDGQNRVLTEFLVANQSTAPTLFLGDDFIYRGAQLLASTGPLNGIQHYHTDHLGTPRLLTNASGAKTAFHTYYPFGIEATSPSQNARRLKFTAHERDMDPGGNRHSDYMHARYSATQLGRFLSVDPTWESAEIASPQSWNRYSYVRNTAINNTDPDGRICIPCAAVGGLIGGVYESYRQVRSGEPVNNARLLAAVAIGAAGGAAAPVAYYAACEPGEGCDRNDSRSWSIDPGARANRRGDRCESRRSGNRQDGCNRR